MDPDWLEIFVETLVGAVFEMRLSKLETISNIKHRLQRLEGIPKQQMHLLFRGKELSDSTTLADNEVENGSTLKLVLTLRGGPINTRRVPFQSSSTNATASTQRGGTADVPEELQQIMANNRDQLMDKIPKDGQVTVLVFQDGEKVNLYHVLEKPDGSFSPLSNSSLSGNSLRNLFNETQNDDGIEEEEEEDPILAERLKQNAITMTKMSNLKLQLENLSMKKNEKKRRKKPFRSREASGKLLRRHMNSRNGYHERTESISNNNNNLSSSQEQNQFKLSFNDSIALPPIHKKDNRRYEEDLNSTTTTSIVPLPLKAPASAGTHYTHQSSRTNPTTSNHNMNYFMNRSALTKLPDYQNNVPEWLQKNSSNFPTHTKRNCNDTDDNIFSTNANTDPAHGQGDRTDGSIDVVDLKFGQNNFEILRTRKTQRLISTDIGTLQGQQNPVQATRTQRRQKGSTSSHQHLSDSNESKFGSIKSLDDELDLSSNAKDILSSHNDNLDTEAKKVVLHGRRSFNPSHNKSHQARPKSGRNSSSRMSYRPNSTRRRKKTPKPRCSQDGCRKKLNITNGFPCRCQKLFCAKHRHPEIHDCQFDYKSEGRKNLKKENPIVIFPKLPKI